KASELSLGSWSKPEITIFDAEHFTRKLGQLAIGRERSGVDQKRGQNFCITVFARVHIQKEIRNRAFESRSPAFVDCKSGTGNLYRTLEIQNPRLLPNFPMRSRLKIKLWRSAPPPDFHVVLRVCSRGH